MHTQVIKIDPLNPEVDKIKDAALVLANGGLVAFPTETVYGLGANLNNKEALLRLYEVKNRPRDKPFTVQIADKDNVSRFASDIAPYAWRIIDKFWPGPLTMVLNAKDNGKVGLRIPNNKIALNLLLEAEVPLAVPSANISFNPVPLTAEDVLRDLDGKIELIVDGGRVELGIESTVADASAFPIKILRPGAISAERIEETANSEEVLFVCTGNSCRSVMAKYLLEKELKILKKDNILVYSCGISAIEGMGATSSTQVLLQEEGLDARGHRAIRIDDKLLRRADLVLAMASLHREEIIRFYPEFKNRVYLLSEISDHVLVDIADPIGQPQEEYRRCFLQIKELVKRLARRI